MDWTVWRSMYYSRRASRFSQCSPSQRLGFWKCWKSSLAHLSPASSSTMVKDLRSTFFRTVGLLHLGNGSNALPLCRDSTDLLTQVGECYREVSRHRPADSKTSEARSPIRRAGLRDSPIRCTDAEDPAFSGNVPLRAIHSRFVCFAQELRTRARKNVTLDSIKVPVCVFCFDCLYLNGESLLERPLTERRASLYNAVNTEPGIIQFAEHRVSTDVEELQVFFSCCLAVLSVSHLCVSIS